MRDLRILLVDDHEVVRLGLKALLSRHPRFEIVGEAGTAEEALAIVTTALVFAARSGSKPAARNSTRAFFQ